MSRGKVNQAKRGAHLRTARGIDEEFSFVGINKQVDDLLFDQNSIYDLTVQDLMLQGDDKLSKIAQDIISHAANLTDTTRAKELELQEETLADKLEDFSRKHFFHVTPEKGELSTQPLSVRLLNPIAYAGVFAGMISETAGNWKVAGSIALLLPVRELRNELKDYQDDIEKAELKRDDKLRYLRGEWVRKSGNTVSFLSDPLPENIAKTLLQEIKHDSELTKQFGFRNRLRYRFARLIRDKEAQAAFRNMLIAKKIAEVRALDNEYHPELDVQRTKIFKRLMHLERFVDRETFTPEFVARTQLALICRPAESDDLTRDIVIEELNRSHKAETI